MKDMQRTMRKAAVLVASLDADHAEAILAQMSPAQVEALRAAVDALGPIDPAEQQEVIEEFFRIGPLVPDREPAGIELDAPQAVSADNNHEATADAPATRDEPATEFLREASAESLATFLAREHPQTVAVVISNLPAARAAEVLAGLPAELQVAVARRLVDLDETDPEVLAEIERGVQSWLAESERSDRRRAAGRTALSNILQAANPRTRDHILANLAPDEAPQCTVAAAPQPPSLCFAELTRFDAISLASVLHHADRELLALALAGAQPEFAERALLLLPPERSRRLRRAIQNLGPTRLADIEEAQRALADLATQLELDGHLAGNVRRHLSVAV